MNKTVKSLLADERGVHSTTEIANLLGIPAELLFEILQSGQLISEPAEGGLRSPGPRAEPDSYVCVGPQRHVYWTKSGFTEVWGCIVEHSAAAENAFLAYRFCDGARTLMQESIRGRPIPKGCHGEETGIDFECECSPRMTCRREQRRLDALKAFDFGGIKTPFRLFTYRGSHGFILGH
jgi:hypothetical protein